MRALCRGRLVPWWPVAAMPPARVNCCRSNAGHADITPPTLNNASTPITANSSAARPCTQAIDTRRNSRSPTNTTGTLASISPSVVPITTAASSG